MLIYIYEKQRKIYGHLTVAQYPNTRISFWRNSFTQILYEGKAFLRKRNCFRNFIYAFTVESVSINSIGFRKLWEETEIMLLCVGWKLYLIIIQLSCLNMSPLKSLPKECDYGSQEL
jgi:hypothetical protein